MEGRGGAKTSGDELNMFSLCTLGFKLRNKRGQHQDESHFNPRQADDLISTSSLPLSNHLALFYLTLPSAFLRSAHPSCRNCSMLFLSSQNSPLFQYLHDLGHTDFEACPTASQEEEYGGAEGDLDSPDEDPHKTPVSLSLS